MKWDWNSIIRERDFLLEENLFFLLGLTLVRGYVRTTRWQKCVIDSLTFVAFQLATWFEENTRPGEVKLVRASNRVNDTHPCCNRKRPTRCYTLIRPLRRLVCSIFFLFKISARLAKLHCSTNLDFSSYVLSFNRRLLKLFVP